MIRILFLLTPVYVSLFWAIALTVNNENQNAPRLLLSKLLFLIAISFFFHFLYFAPYPELYVYVDILLYLFGSLLFPLFYIYFRLLTVDSVFSFKKHGIYLLIPNITVVVYITAVFFTPSNEYRTWLFNEHAYNESTYIYFLNIIRLILRIQLMVITIACFIGSYSLIKKYGAKAEEYYSDIIDGKFHNAKKLSSTIVYASIICFVAVAAGRQFIIVKEYSIYIIWTVLSLTFYIIGYMGMKQKPVNPTFELENEMSLFNNTEQELYQEAQKKVLYKLTIEFEENKLFLDNQLTINELARIVGTNRSFISAVINQHYNQNFCSFVNFYRLYELENIFLENPHYANETLAQRCGFGSVSSMKRSLKTKTGLSISEWKKQILLKLL